MHVNLHTKNLHKTAYVKHTCIRTGGVKAIIQGTNMGPVVRMV